MAAGTMPAAIWQFSPVTEPMETSGVKHSSLPLTVTCSSHAEEHGASAVEYAILITLIATVIFAAAFGLGQALPDLYESVCPAFGCGE